VKTQTVVSGGNREADKGIDQWQAKKNAANCGAQTEKKMSSKRPLLRLSQGEKTNESRNIDWERRGGKRSAL